MPTEQVNPEQVIQYNKVITLTPEDNTLTITFDVPEGKELVVQVKIWGDYREPETSNA